MPKPLVIIVTGRPCTGKSTLARELADFLRLPLLSRDSLKEGYVRTQARPHAELRGDTNLRITELFFSMLKVFCRVEVSVVTEAAFQHAVWASRIADLGDLADMYFIVCDCDDTVLEARWAQRVERDGFHGYAHGRRQTPSYIAPNLAFPLLTVNTADGYKPGIDIVRKFAENRLTGG